MLFQFNGLYNTHDRTGLETVVKVSIPHRNDRTKMR